TLGGKRMKARSRLRRLRGPPSLRPRTKRAPSPSRRKPPPCSATARPAPGPSRPLRPGTKSCRRLRSSALPPSKPPPCSATPPAAPAAEAPDAIAPEAPVQRSAPLEAAPLLGQRALPAGAQVGDVQQPEPPPVDLRAPGRAFRDPVHSEVPQPRVTPPGARAVAQRVPARGDIPLLDRPLEAAGLAQEAVDGRTF